MATNRYAATGLTGGTDGDVDKIDGSVLNDGDTCVATVTDTVYEYRLNASSGAAESSPDVISPDSNAGTKRWILQKGEFNELTTGKATVDDGTYTGSIEFSGTELQVYNQHDGGPVALRADNAGGTKKYVFYGDPDDVSYLYYAGNTVISTTAEGLSPVSGIKFPTVQNASTNAQTLDDYEEGTWTPVVADDPSAGNLASGTFIGYYTKIGRIVTVIFSLADINTSGMTGGNTLHIRGFPFGCDAISAQGSCVFDQFTITGEDVVIEIPDGASRARFAMTTTNANDTFLTVADVAVSGSSDARCTLTYQTST